MMVQNSRIQERQLDTLRNSLQHTASLAVRQHDEGEPALELARTGPPCAHMDVAPFPPRGDPHSLNCLNVRA